MLKHPISSRIVKTQRATISLTLQNIIQEEKSITKRKENVNPYFFFRIVEVSTVDFDLLVEIVDV